jgi:hypothetical protein
MSSHVARMFFDCGPKDRIRVVLNWKGELRLRPVFWLKFAWDGGVYAGPRAPQRRIKEIRHGHVDPAGSKECRVNYSDGEKVVGTVNTKLSFHPSGEFHLPGAKIQTQPFGPTAHPRLLCHVAFQHPSSFAKITPVEIEERDILLDGAVDELRLLLAWLHLLPTPPIFVEPEGLERQIDLVFRCSGFQSIPDYFLALAIGPGPVSQWPIRTLMLVPSD